MHQRQHAVDRAGQDVHDALHLVEHAGPLDTRLGRLPDQRDSRAQRVEDAAALQRRGALVVELLDERRGVLEVVQQRAAPRFGRVRGQDRVDLEAVDRLADLVRRHAARVELGDGRRDALVQG
jgi:hypothetical protein